jgi:hypothetical protein
MASLALKPKQWPIVIQQEFEDRNVVFQVIKVIRNAGTLHQAGAYIQVIRIALRYHADLIVTKTKWPLPRRHYSRYL